MSHCRADNVHFDAGIRKGVGVVRMQGIDDLLAPSVQLRLIVLFGQADEHRVEIGLVYFIVHDLCILDARCIDRLANRIDVRRVVESDLQFRAAAEINA